MSTWLDNPAAPNVVIVAETALTEQGTVEDALLFVLDESPERVQLTDLDGTRRTFQLPAEALAGNYLRAGIDLQTQTEKT